MVTKPWPPTQTFLGLRHAFLFFICVVIGYQIIFVLFPYRRQTYTSHWLSSLSFIMSLGKWKKHVLMTECIFFYSRINTQHIRLTLYLAHEIALWQIQKFICYCTGIALFTLYFQYKPPRAHIRRGDLTEVFCVTSFRGFMEGLIFGILRY